MAATLLRIHPDNPPQNRIQQAVEVLRSGGVIIYPTDTIYGLGCDIHNARAVEKLCRIKGIKPDKANLSFICSDLSHITDYANGITTPVYKVLKKALPGPFTFIFEASTKAPKYGGVKRKTVGIRVPDHNICLALVRELGNPIVSTSVHDDDEILEYSTDPDLIFEKYRPLVDLVIDGGFGHNVASTVIDCTDEDFNIIRQGAGDIEQYL
ncbi:threonylcarbamoyl-AMP synthase [Hymenobacter lutimineralis]|uniref:Threonylcarbamoyl-AMP synthase n=1 Tax=Hymenobacter lutimineralis TaxID=2606448 RepID=A0A5D6VBD2_9BACT|nr:MULTISPECIES: L-threonylcarbamoyladenylate synthase [Hymenobacter]QIX62563.1 threonylcarbamoyl-AMP synthase [Hymenobacter sp. BT18]TYZ11874.1 threonylcarbamoyl-AMP synthase [Hymenobacter lutimineralis]